VLIRPTAEELKDFVPDFTIYNAGGFPANRFTAGMTSTTSVEVNFKRKEMVILGTEYAGEMKKGIFSVMVSCYWLSQVSASSLSIVWIALPPTSQVRPAVASLFCQRG
jgi:phosphoenolpyruvate carboxykinase (ATP)